MSRVETDEAQGGDGILGQLGRCSHVIFRTGRRQTHSTYEVSFRVPRNRLSGVLDPLCECRARQASNLEALAIVCRGKKAQERRCCLRAGDAMQSSGSSILMSEW